MSSGLATLSPGKTKSSSGQLSRRAYMLGVTALAVFLAGLLIVPTTEKQFQASATLLLETPQDGATAVETLQRQLTTDDLLRRVLAKLGPPKGTENLYSEQFPPYSEIERVRQALHIECLTPGLTGRARLRLTTNTRDPDRGIALIDGLISEAAGASSSSAPGVDALANEAIELLRQEELSARQQLDSFLDQHFHTTLAGVQQALDASSHVRAGGQGIDESDFAARDAADRRGAGEPIAREREENPAWRKLNEEFDQQSKQRAQMLEKFTALHPQVIAVDAKIKELQERLNATPRFIDSPLPKSPAPPAGTTSPAAVTQASALTIDTTAIAGAEQDYRQLQARLTSARENLLVAEQAVGGDIPATVTPGVHVADGPRIARSWGGSPRGLGLGLLAVLALGAGAAVAWFAGPPTTAKPTLASSQQVRETLGLPVVGELSGGNTAQPPADRARRQWAQRAVRGCELALLVLVAALLLTALLDSPFLAEAAENPLGAVPQIARRLSDMF